MVPHWTPDIGWDHGVGNICNGFSGRAERWGHYPCDMQVDAGMQ